MEPDIKDGSLIFLDKSKKEIDSTNIYVINTPDGTFIKKLNIYNDKVYLKSNNQAYNDIEFKIDEIDIVGRVCGVITRV